jgi:endogenous inhibitor of DNA gyrase (YacG/DUF329 family)
VSATRQQHCPACGRWLKRARLWCERPYCYQRAPGRIDTARVLYRANNYRAQPHDRKVA